MVQPANVALEFPVGDIQAFKAGAAQIYVRFRGDGAELFAKAGVGVFLLQGGYPAGVLAEAPGVFRVEDTRIEAAQQHLVQLCRLPPEHHQGHFFNGHRLHHLSCSSIVNRFAAFSEPIQDLPVRRIGRDFYVLQGKKPQEYLLYCKVF